jgi:hypothetical protein
MMAGRLAAGWVPTVHLRRAFAWFVLGVAAFVFAKSWPAFS